ncbi:MAG TPA: hypothetical protein VN894_18655, partial [Polyangiaceae bacterium]|nr:hypothetical protein [Polyangiaceae bacterium]
MRKMLPSSCVTITTVSCVERASVTTRSSSAAAVTGSSPAWGSSRKTISGSSASARAMAARFRHAAGDLGGELVAGGLEPDEAQLRARDHVDGVRPERGPLLERECGVLEHGHRAEERTLLEHDAEGRNPSIEIGRAPSGDVDVAFRRPLQADQIT